MYKFFVYSLGVLGIMFGSIVHAAERFEILPDLPESLSYAVQPAAASTISGNATNAVALNSQSIGQEPSIISVILSLVFVIVLIYITGIVFMKLNKVGINTLKRQQPELSKSQVSVVSTTQLGNNKTLHVVELDGKKMLIGASSNAIQLIKDLGDSEDSKAENEYSHIEIPNIKIPKIEIPKIEIPTINFSKLVTKAHKGLNNIDRVSDEEKDNNVQSESTIDNVENVAIEESSIDSNDGIIDTLFNQNDLMVDEVALEEPVKSEHVVDPDDFALYKKYLN